VEIPKNIKGPECRRGGASRRKQCANPMHRMRLLQPNWFASIRTAIFSFACPRRQRSVRPHFCENGFDGLRGSGRQAGDREAIFRVVRDLSHEPEDRLSISSLPAAAPEAVESV